MTCTPSPTSSDLAIDMVDVVKHFGAARALDRLSMTVPHGEVLGFLGPNGAGKSTTMRILLGVLRHDSGHIRLLAGDPWADAVALHSRLAYVPGDVELWPNMTGGEAIDLFSRLRGGVNGTKRDELIEQFQLDPRKKCRTYSKGNRQKVALIAALAADVDLLLLDEPTSGLDPLMESVFQRCIAEAKAAGTTVLLSSHILAQVEALADRISIVRGGRVVETGSLSELRHLSRTAVAVETSQPLGGRFAQHPGVHGIHVDGHRAHFDVDGANLNAVLRTLADHHVSSITATPPTLEQILLRHYDSPAQRREDISTAPPNQATQR